MHGGALTGNSGQLASPLYPRNYPNNVDYHWSITVNAGMYIQVDFLDIDIEIAQNQYCTYDYVRVRMLGLYTQIQLFK